MASKYIPADLSKVRTYPLEQRPTKVEVSTFATLCSPNSTLETFLDSLPLILKATDLREVVERIVWAHQNGKPVIMGIGGHVIKCGLSPLLIHLMEQGIVTGLAMNGGASIHDVEVALIGRTSENVAASLRTGDFGMVREPPAFINSAIREGYERNIGMGESLGKKLIARDAPFRKLSVLAEGARLAIPVTVHVSIGGDTTHMHPSASGDALGETSFTDFRILVTMLRELDNGGVYLNIGSAVVLPEIFLKALNLARNISGKEITNFTTVNMDMMQHYRPLENVVKRPTVPGGRGYALTGHHEIMVPLLIHLVRAKVEKNNQGRK